MSHIIKWLKPKDESYHFIFLGSSTFSIGGSIIAFHCYKKSISDYVAPVIVATAAGFSLSFLAALKLYNSCPEKMISKEAEMINEAYSGFRRTELVTKLYPVLSEEYLDINQNWAEDLRLLRCEIEKKLKVLNVWDELYSFKSKSMSKEYQKRYKLKKILREEVEGLMSRYDETRSQNKDSWGLNCAFLTDVMNGLNIFLDKYKALSQKFKEARRAKFDPFFVDKNKPASNVYDKAFQNVLFNSTNDFMEMVCKFMSSNKDIPIDDVLFYVIYHGNLNTDKYGGGRNGWINGVEVAKHKLNDWIYENPGSTKYVNAYRQFRETVIEKCGLDTKDYSELQAKNIFNKVTPNVSVVYTRENGEILKSDSLKASVTAEIHFKEPVLRNSEDEDTDHTVNGTTSGSSETEGTSSGSSTEMEEKSLECGEQTHTSPEKEMAASNFQIEE